MVAFSSFLNSLCQIITEIYTPTLKLSFITFSYLFWCFLVITITMSAILYSLYLHSTNKKWKTIFYFIVFHFLSLIKLFLYSLKSVLVNYSPSKILSNSSPSIFSFSINTLATACNLSIWSFKIFVALSYPASTIFLTSSSIIAAVSSE